MPVAALSGGQRQTVADRPVAARRRRRSSCWTSRPRRSACRQTAEVLDLIERLRERGLGVIVISHNLDDVFAVADRIVVLRLGRRVGDLRHAPGPTASRSSRPSPATADLRPAAIPSDEALRAPTPIDRDGRPRSSRERPLDRRPAGGRSVRRVRRVRSRTCARRCRQGELGNLPVILGLVVIWIYFQLRNDRFLSAGNLTNLVLQMRPSGRSRSAWCWCCCSARSTCRSASVSGFCAATMVVLNMTHGWRAPGDHRRAGEPAPSSGRSTALGHALPGPSFVVTLAGLLAWQGACSKVLGRDRERSTSPTRGPRRRQHLLRRTVVT